MASLFGSNSAAESNKEDDKYLDNLNIILWNASLCGHDDICNLVIEKGGNPKITKVVSNAAEKSKMDEDTYQNHLNIILWNACVGDHYDICKLAIEKGGDPSYYKEDDEDEVIAMVIAFYYNHKEIAHLLANNMSEDDLLDELANCMMCQEVHFATDYTDLFRFLLEHNVNPDGNNEDFIIDRTKFKIRENLRPLHYAAFLNNLDMCKMLIEFGADATLLSDRNVISYLKDAENQAKEKKEMAVEEKEDENTSKRARIEK